MNNYNDFTKHFFLKSYSIQINNQQLNLKIQNWIDEFNIHHLFQLLEKDSNNNVMLNDKNIAIINDINRSSLQEIPSNYNIIFLDIFKNILELIIYPYYSVLDQYKDFFSIEVAKKDRDVEESNIKSLPVMENMFLELLSSSKDYLSNISLLGLIFLRRLKQKNEINEKIEMIKTLNALTTEGISLAYGKKPNITRDLIDDYKQFLGYKKPTYLTMSLYSWLEKISKEEELKEQKNKGD